MLLSKIGLVNRFLPRSDLSATEAYPLHALCFFPIWIAPADLMFKYNYISKLIIKKKIL